MVPEVFNARASRPARGFRGLAPRQSARVSPTPRLGRAGRCDRGARSSRPSELSKWQQRFPGCEPVAHRLRATFPDRRVRFHSLPGAKCYPEDEGEYATVIDRRTRVLGELTGPDRRVVLLTTGYSEAPELVRRQPELRTLDPDAVPWRTVPMHESKGKITTPRATGTCSPANGSGDRASSTRSSGWLPIGRSRTSWSCTLTAGGSCLPTTAAWT